MGETPKKQGDGEEVKEIRREKRLDEFLKRWQSKKLAIRKYMTEVESPITSPILIEGTIARTDPSTGIPHLDELTHHLIAVSIASLKFNSPEVTLAALIHDYFKPVFDIKWNSSKNRWEWHHFITDKDLYSQLLLDFKDSLNVFEVANISQWHHKRKECNKICQIEKSELISALETSLPFIVPTRKEHTVAYHLRIPGKYRMFLLALLKEKLAEILSEKYSEKLNEILGITRIRYEYRPIKNDAMTVEDVGKLIKDEGWKLAIDDGTLIIPLPSKFHEHTFYFEYHEKPEVILDVDTRRKTIRGVKVPFGKALSTVYLVGSQDAFVVYVDGGLGTLDLETILTKTIHDLKVNVHINTKKVSEALEGKFESDSTCVFCGEPGESVGKNEKVGSILKAKFTDTWLFLTHGQTVCPACKLGFEIEEKFRMSGLSQYLSQEAIIEKVDVLADIPIFKRSTFMRSVSSKIWLELLSDIYYSLHTLNGKIMKKNTWMAGFYLDPQVVMYPYLSEIIPQVLMISSRYMKKKFVLQSGLHSNVVFPGNEKDMIPEEFVALRKFYKLYPNAGIRLLRKIRSVYSPILGIPKIEIQKGGGSHARKRKH